MLLRAGVAEQGVTPPACQRRHWLSSGVVIATKGDAFTLTLFNTIVTGVLQPPHAPAPTVLLFPVFARQPLEQGALVLIEEVGESQIR